MSTDQYLCNWFFPLTSFLPNVIKFDKQFLHLRQATQEKYIPGLSDKHKLIQSVQVLSAATYFSGQWSLLPMILNQNVLLWGWFNHLCQHWAALKGRSASSLLGSFLMQKLAGASFSLGSGLSVVYDPARDPSGRKCLALGFFNWTLRFYTFQKESLKLLVCFKRPSLDVGLCPREYLNLWKSCSHRHLRMHCQKLKEKSSAPVCSSGLLFSCFVTGIWVEVAPLVCVSRLL